MLDRFQGVGQSPLLVGYTKADIPALVQGTLPQARVTKLSPGPASDSDLTRLFEESLSGWKASLL